jgi:hypothetical protein
LEKAVSVSHNLDSIAAEGLRFAQEIEVVSRGYQFGQPLPPISRLENKQPSNRCRGLRTQISAALKASINHSIEAHSTIQRHTKPVDLQRYHGIYEVSLQDYTDAVEFANRIAMESHDSLTELRLLFRMHFIARKVFLCDLLALRSGTTWENTWLWRKTLGILQDFHVSCSETTKILRTVVLDETYGEEATNLQAEESGEEEDRSTDVVTPHKQHIKAQMRRFDAVANSIRSLNAKARISKDEINAAATGTEEQTLSTTLTRHYESLGAEIRGALIEWEKGRNTMYFNVGMDSDRRISAASSTFRTPSSPSPSSLGGMTVVDGGPAEAFKLLNGEGQGNTEMASLDEEVFEAVAMPRQRMSWAPMSREEKLSKLQEDRRKRATLQEQAETTTSMLRELQMVIKHRPMARSDARITSI